MNPKEAIQKAVDSGYKYRNKDLRYDANLDEWYVDDSDGGYLVLSENLFFIDPEFWKCLGMAMKWCSGVELPNGLCNNCRRLFCDSSWLHHWHNFIDTLAEGKTIDDYFETI